MEILQADIHVTRDRVEQSLETANYIAISFRDILSGSVPCFVDTGICIPTSESVATEVVDMAMAAPIIDESAWNAVLPPAVPN